MGCRVSRFLYKMWTVFVFAFSLAIVAVTHADEFTLVKLASVPGGSNCMNQGTVIKYDIADCKAECRSRPKCDTMNYCPKTGGGCRFGECVLKSCNSGRPVTNGNYRLGGNYRGFATWAKDTYILRKPSTKPGMSGCEVSQPSGVNFSGTAKDYAKVNLDVTLSTIVTKGQVVQKETAN